MPQDAEQKTAETQPIPRTASSSRTAAAGGGVARVKKPDPGPAKNVPISSRRSVHASDDQDMLIYEPGPKGGNNWEPTSYNHETKMFYVCAADQTSGCAAADNWFIAGEGLDGVGAIAGSGGTRPRVPSPRSTRRRQGRLAEDVAGGVLQRDGHHGGQPRFVGRNSGELQAYNATNGEQLWSFQTGAGANDTVSVFEQDGKQYVAFLSAGNSLIASPHGDSLWLFSLDGTMGPAQAPGAGSGTGARRRKAAIRAGARRRQTRRRGRPSSPTTVPAVTGWTARAATVART